METTAKKRRIKILIIAINPKNTERLRLDEEIRDIKSALLQSQLRDKIKIEEILAVRKNDIQEMMLVFQPDFVLIIGHGLKEKGIVLEDNFGNSKPINPKALADFFGFFKSKTKCVILNTCYSEKSAMAIAKYIKYVIGIRKSIRDETARDFSLAFFRAIGAGKSIKFAYKFAFNDIQWENNNKPKSGIVFFYNGRLEYQEDKLSNSRLAVV